MKKVSNVVAEITAAIREQATSIGHVNQAVLQLDQTTQKNAMLAAQAASNSQTINEQTQHLQNLIKFFRLVPT